MQKKLTTTVTYVNLEGGFWGLTDAAGEQYEPADLPAPLQREGLRCRVKVSYPDTFSSRMWGIPVIIEQYEIIKPEPC